MVSSRPGPPGYTRGETTMNKATTKTAKNTNIEGKFFGMIVLAWAILAVVFNIVHSALPQAKSPVAAKVAAAPAHAAPAAKVASIR
jgi:hypothetical protein